MKLIEERKNLLAGYLGFFIWGIALVILKLLPVSPVLIFLGFLLLIFLPGFALGRILKIQYEKDAFGQLILVLALGFIFNLSLSFLAIIFGLTIAVFIKIYLVIFILLYFLALFLDLKRPPSQIESISLANILGNIFQLKNQIYLPLIILVIMILASVDISGTNFTGDPLIHLTYLRKVVENQPLTSENLGYIKELHIASAIPIWHVFLGFLTKVFGTNIFILYREIPTALTLIVFLVWYWLMLKIMPTRLVAVLATILFGLYHFTTNGYFYTRLAVPDTISQLIFLPLALALAIKYIADKTANYSQLIVLSLIVTLMGLIHWTHYFYYLAAIGLFGILYLIYQLPKFDWPVFRKILLALFANLILVGPLLLYLKGIASQTMANFANVKKGSNNDRFYKFLPYGQLSYVFLPLLLVFWRRYWLLILIFAVFLVGPIVYNFPGLYGLLRHYLSHVFVNRLYTNLGEWPFVIWAIILGFLLVLIDRILVKLNKTWRYLIDGFLLLFGALIIQNDFYHRVFSGGLHDWLNRYYHWLILAMLITGLLIYIWQKYSPKISGFFGFDETRDWLTATLLVIIIAFFLSSLGQDFLKTSFSKAVASARFFRPAADPTLLIVNPKKFGGLQTIEFIRQNLPSKVVFDTTDANYVLAMFVDVHMASHTFDSDPTKKYAKIYEPQTSEAERLRLVAAGQIEYILFLYQGNYPASPGQTPFDQDGQNFQKIYSNGQAAIYKVK